MLASVYQRLSTIPIPQRRDEYHQEAITTFFQLLHLLSRGLVVEHPAIVSLTGEVFQRLLQQPRSSLCLGKVRTMRVVRPVTTQPSIPIIFLPGNYLQEVRVDPLSILGRMVALCCQYLDLLSQNEPEVHELEQRASAYEAHLLLCLRAAHSQEGLAFTPNQRQRQLLKRFPHGLESLALELALFSWLQRQPNARP
jgi:hypothetical protein